MESVATLATGQDYLSIAEAHGIDLTVVGPEAPLMDGIVDAFQDAGRLIVGPRKNAARLEGSKIFAKEFFTRASIPTARYATASTEEAALAALDRFDAPVVLKADGLAAGKGVVIAETMDEARQLIPSFLSGALAGPAGRSLVIEEFLRGEEVSVIALTDGETILPLLPAQDHKQLWDGDTGPNTGGMGAYVDERILPTQDSIQVMNQVLRPAVDGMRSEGYPFTGFLYAGLMMTSTGPKLLEFNVRCGDPETQPLMYRLASDLGLVLHAAAKASLEGIELEWSSDPSVAVVIAAKGYPREPQLGDRIHGIDEAEAEGCKVFQAGTRFNSDGHLVTAGGRVLSVVASDSTLPKAIERAYRAVGHIRFDGMHFRKDIGGKGLKRW
jgi:phosphoribosylamine--glycine ligase